LTLVWFFLGAAITVKPEIPEKSEPDTTAGQQWRPQQETPSTAAKKNKNDKDASIVNYTYEK